jgi:hypothetical protein
MAATTLPTLIKRATHAVEQVQKQLAQTQAAEAALLAQQAEWQVALNPQAAPEQAAEFNPTHGAYVAHGRAELARLAGLLMQVHDLKKRQLTELREHFAEQKRYEVLLAAQAAKTQARISKKQQAALDEAAGVLAARGREG